MTEKMKLESLDGWWNEMNVFQKKMVQRLVQMLGDVPVDQEALRAGTCCQVEIRVVMGSVTNDPGAGTTGAAYRSN